ncbi:hypothetical protein [uncultured Tateyamaria sp.]|uniref:hypothetical protein n=1 Tax=uncultured Tateyamaria sp. TaxID=455651 RepID=UPI0026209C93|nr:hypothetical protein [uncultured Tateyamaria sp.]
MTLLRACLAAFALNLSTSLAFAELAPEDLTRIDAPGEYRLLSSDGAVIGLTDGISVQEDRVRMFLRARGGSIFSVRGGGKDIVVTTYATSLSLNGSDLVLNVTTQRIKNRANMSFTDDSSPIEILLLNRR